MLDRLRKKIAGINADFVDIRYEIKRETRISCKGPEITEAGSSTTDGYVVRVLKDKGFAATAVTREEDIERGLNLALERQREALGATPVRHRNWYLCCGKACQTEDIPSNMMRDLLGTVNDENADILGMICPTCFGQFDFGQMKISKMFDEDFNTPPVYYFQLLAYAQGVPYEKLGFNRQRYKPECLLKWQETNV